MEEGGGGVQEGGGAWGSKKSNHDSNLSRQIFNSCSHTISHICFFQVLYLGYGNNLIKTRFYIQGIL